MTQQAPHAGGAAGVAAPPVTPWQQVLSHGLELHQAGRLAEAERAYRQVLLAEPGQPDALHLLGVVGLQQGRLDEAQTRVQEALQHSGDNATYWNTLGQIERAAGHLDAAAAGLTRATALAPGYAEAWANLAAVQGARGDAEAEAAALVGLTAVLPTHPWAWGRRGVLAFQAGHAQDAAEHFARVAALAPEDAGAWSNLGAAQVQLGQYAEAEASLRRALACYPDSVDALNNLGGVLNALARWDDAGPVLERATALAPSEPNGWVNLGHARKGQGRHADAIDSYERALALQPGKIVALVGLGDALQESGALQRAISCYERALAGSPRDPEAYDHLEIALQRLGGRGEATASSDMAADLARMATALREMLAVDPDCPLTHSYLIVVLDVTEGAEAEAEAERRRWNERFGGRTRGPRPLHTNDPDPARRLRVGYVSADFYHHSAAYAILPILRAHDHTQVNVYCYSGVTAPDPITEEFRACADVWRDTARLSDDDLAALIRQDGIDILVDLGGHSRANRLTVFAREPAPVQVTAWGYAAGTGLDTMHYFLADPIALPPEARSAYTEQVVDLPSLLCYAPPAGAPAVVPPPCVERGYVTFGAYNRLPKISAASVAAWGRVMAAVPDARLAIKSGGLEHEAERRGLLDRLAAGGVDPERVTLLGGTGQADHLAAHGDVDLMLDTFPQSGGITTLDALLMGVPMVTLLGERVGGRASASFLTTLGLGDLVARTVDAYVEIAVRLAGDVDRLARERTTLRERLLASPIGDGRVYTRHVEAAYRALWQAWCAEQPTSDGWRFRSGPPDLCCLAPFAPFKEEPVSCPLVRG